jgi:hypothetical protein
MGIGMEKLHKEALQVSKEILVKFIESGRVSPATFSEVFPFVYKVICDTIAENPFSATTSAESERVRRKEGR